MASGAVGPPGVPNMPLPLRSRRLLPRCHGNLPVPLSPRKVPRLARGSALVQHRPGEDGLRRGRRVRRDAGRAAARAAGQGGRDAVHGRLRAAEGPAEGRCAGAGPGHAVPAPGHAVPAPENYVRHAARRRLASNAGWGGPAGLCPAAGSRMVLAGGGAGALHGAGAQVNFLVLLLTHQAIGFSCLFFFFHNFKN